MNKWLLIIDGGATKTACAIVHAESGEIQYTTTMGGSNYQAIGIESATEILRALLSKARVFLQDQAISKIAVATFAMAGIDSPKDHQNVTAMVHEAITAEQLDIHTLIVENDAQATLLGVTEGQAGALLIAGTGAIAYAFDGQQIARTGGWGTIVRAMKEVAIGLGRKSYVPFFGWKMVRGSDAIKRCCL